MGVGVVRRHIVVLHRWRARYAEYERYVDHRRDTVTYITTEVGADGVPPEAAEVVIVRATDDTPAVRRELRALAGRHGAPAAGIAAPAFAGPYAETVLGRGEILPAADAYYEHVGGRFRFRGSNTAAVAEAIGITARDFRVRAAAIPETRSA